MNEKETNHPAHPMDRTANWCSHGGCFTLAQVLVFFLFFMKKSPEEQHIDTKQTKK